MFKNANLIHPPIPIPSLSGKTVMCLSLTRPEVVESLLVEDISPRVSSSIGLIPNFIEAMKRAELSSPDLSLSQVGSKSTRWGQLKLMIATNKEP